MQRILMLALICLLGWSAAAGGDKIAPMLPATEGSSLDIGKIIYREGLQEHGEPLFAMVQGDIPVDGRMFTCDDCHQRSGLGSLEGTIISPRTNGKDLYQPWRRTGAWKQPEDEQARTYGRQALPPQYQTKDERPAYTRETLAGVIRTGVGANGKELDRIMPRYLLDQRNMGHLINYLEQLSSQFSPGIDDTTIRFATVVSSDVKEEARKTMLDVLQAHMNDRNSQSRHQGSRAKKGPFYKSEKYGAYRQFALDVWELHGPARTWRKQLDDYYAKQPVFALLGGVVDGPWRPIHEFSEENEVPCILPLTDRPVLTKTDWYTLYFSKGFFQEGEAAARYLRSHPDFSGDAEFVQVYQGDANGTLLADGFRSIMDQWDGKTVEDIQLNADEKFTTDLWPEKFKKPSTRHIMFWLDGRHLPVLEKLARESAADSTIFVSAELLGEALWQLPTTVREKVYITYPFELPQDRGRKVTVVEQWLKAHNIPITNIDVQAKMYFLGWMLSGAVKSMGDDYFRDYFLECFDMMVDQTYAIAIFPRLSFGPGQRYASKGCYMTQVTSGENPQLVPLSDWVIH